MGEDGKLVEEYRAAWLEFDASLRKLQAASATAEVGNIESLFVDVERARLKYSSARDRLVSRMLEADGPGVAPRSDEARIRGAARLLWEFEGKPGNSAERDWLRAEALVRNAAALIPQ